MTTADFPALPIITRRVRKLDLRLWDDRPFAQVVDEDHEEALRIEAQRQADEDAGGVCGAGTGRDRRRRGRS